MRLTYNQLLDSLSPELFRDPSCSAIFTAARAVRSAGGEADVVGVMAAGRGVAGLTATGP